MGNGGDNLGASVGGNGNATAGNGGKGGNSGGINAAGISAARGANAVSLPQSTDYWLHL